MLTLQEQWLDVLSREVGYGGEKGTAWGIHGQLDYVAELTGGRMPGHGEALVSEEAMVKLG